MQNEPILIFTDGGSRGNPGPAACGFAVVFDDRVIFKNSKFLNTTTNNVAEYNAVILALEWLLENENKFANNSIQFILDSELVVRQLNGIYKVKKNELIILNLEIRRLMARSKMKIFFKNVPREKNKIADGLVNEELDRHV